MHKYALVVIDMQRGFLDPSSPLYIAGAADTPPSNDKITDGERSRAIGRLAEERLVVIPRHRNRSRGNFKLGGNKTCKSLIPLPIC